MMDVHPVRAVMADRFGCQAHVAFLVRSAGRGGVRARLPHRPPLAERGVDHALPNGEVARFAHSAVGVLEDCENAGRARHMVRPVVGMLLGKVPRQPLYKGRCVHSRRTPADRLPFRPL